VNQSTITIAVAIIGVLGTVTVALVTYLVARRQNSGRIATSDASTLWVESQAMRKELRDEVLLLRTDVRELRTEIQALKEEIDRLRVRLGVYEKLGEVGQ
jgi:peptidoglycan hydrolase CwlO-like protein